MKKKYVFLWMCIIILAIVGYGKQRKGQRITRSELMEEFNSEYHDYKEKWFSPKSIFTHFPSKIDSLPFQQRGELTNNWIYGYFVLSCHNCDYDSVVSLERKMNEIIVDKKIIPYIAKENDSRVLISENLLNNKVPIPDFKKMDLNIPEEGIDLYSDETVHKLNSNYKLYIIDYDYYENPKNPDLISSLPNRHNMGYSRGVCISSIDRNIIYWTLIF